MSDYRYALPQLGQRMYLTDGGIETTLIFHNGLELPCFAAFHLLETQDGTAALRGYFAQYAGLARDIGAGLILEGPTWRASPDWGARLGYSIAALADANRSSIRLLEEIRSEYETDRTAIVISGCVGPRGDGYVPSQLMSAVEAEAYHRWQIEVLAETTADMICVLTMNYAEEAIGIARAAAAASMPVAISFTVETDGRLATGMPLDTAIGRVDDATGGYPAYYMINCAHPSHFEDVLREREPWVERIRGVRANASRMSHAELNESTELDAGNPVELAREYARLKQRLPGLVVLGGCCGTDLRHISRIAEACGPLYAE